MKCKSCGKELIGKEKHFCNSCWTNGKDKFIIGVKVIGGIALSIGAMILNKDKITDIFKGISKDE